MRRKSVDKKKNYIALIPFFIVICVVLLSIGWAAFQSTFNVSNLYAMVRIDRDIRVTDVQATSNTNSGRSNYENYNVSSLYSAAYLPNQNSTITYKVEITNVGNVKEGIYSIEEIYKIINTDVDSNLEIKSTTLALKEVLCDDTNSSQCKLGSVSTFYVTIGYKENGYDGTHQTHSVTLNFDFRRVFDITYNGFGNTSGIDTQIMQGDTKTIEFNSTTGIPANTTTTGATGSYNPTTHILTLSNVTVTGLNDTIVVSRHYGITYTGFSTGTSNSVTDIIYTGGEIEISSTDEYPNSVAVTNAQGSYDPTTHIITILNITDDIIITATYNSGGSGTWSDPYIVASNTYDYSDLTPGSHEFVNLPGSPRITIDSNNKITKYELQDTGTGVNANNAPMESGVLAFDYAKVTIDLDFTANFNDSGNYYKCVLSALSSSNNSTYSGFRLWNKKKGMMYVNTMNNQSVSSNGAGGYQIIDFSVGNTYGSRSQRYKLRIIFDPSTDELNLTLSPISVDANGNVTTLATYNETGSITTITSAMRSATITIGGNGVNSNHNMGNLTIHGLSVIKG